MVIVIVILSIVSDTLARIGVLKVVDPDQSEKATTYEDTVYAPRARARARIFTKISLVVSKYLINLNLKFRKDPCFR